MQQLNSFKKTLFKGRATLDTDHNGKIFVKNAGYDVERGDMGKSKNTEIVKTINTLMENMKKVRQLKSQGGWDEQDTV